MTLIVKAPSKNVGVFKFDGTKVYPENAVVIHNGILYVKTGEQSTVGIQTTTTTNLTLTPTCSPCARFRKNNETTTKTYTTGIPVFLSPNKDPAWTPVSSDIRDYSDLLKRVSELEKSEQDLRARLGTVETKLSEARDRISKLEAEQLVQDNKIKANENSIQQLTTDLQDKFTQVKGLIANLETKVDQNAKDVKQSLTNDAEVAGKVNKLLDLAGNKVV